MARKARTWTLRNFGGGEDLRDGLFSDEQNRFRELVNYRIAVGKKLRRRPPCTRDAGLLAGASQGITALKGQLYAFAKRGDVIAHTTAVSVQTLTFDVPDFTTTWTLLESVVCAGVVCALIAHDTTGTTYPKRIALHVFDGAAARPTFVEDPFCPAAIQDLPLELSGKAAKNPSYVDYRPRMAVVGGRLAITMPNGDVRLSAVGRPRVWNDRTIADHLSGGVWYYLTAPAAGGTVQSFYVYEDGTLLEDPTVWNGGYMLERWDATLRQWVRLEDAVGPGTLYVPAGVPSSAFQWRADAAAAPATVSVAGLTQVVKVQVYVASASDTLLRFRLFPTPPRTITAAPTYTIDAWGTVAITGAGSTTLDGAATPIAVEETLGPFAICYNSQRQYVVGFGKDTSFHPPPVWGRDYDTVAEDLGASGGALTWPKGGHRFNIRYAKTVITGVNGAAGTISALTFAAGETKANFSAAVTSGQKLLIAAPSGAGYFRGIAAGTGTVAIPIRNAANVAGDYTTLINPVGDFWSNRVAPTSISDYRYGSDAGYESTGYLALKQDLILNRVGADDAGSLPCSAQQVSGTIVGIGALKDRLLLQYRDGTQLWAAPSDIAGVQLLAQEPHGAGDIAQTWPVLVAGALVVPTEDVVRAYQLEGLAFDGLASKRVGDPVARAPIQQQHGAAWWPDQGVLISPVTLGGTLVFRVLEVRPDEKTLAWARWIVTGLSAWSGSDGAIVAVRGRVYFRLSQSLYYFDADATTFRDTTDGAVAFTSRAAWHFNSYKRPTHMVQAIGADLIQANGAGDTTLGKCRLSLLTVPHDLTQQTAAITTEGTTISRGTIPLAAWGVGLAPVIESEDETGHELQELDIRFLERDR